MSHRREDPGALEWLRRLQARVERLEKGNAGVRQNDLRLGNVVLRSREDTGLSLDNLTTGSSRQLVTGDYIRSYGSWWSGQAITEYNGGQLDVREWGWHSCEIVLFSPDSPVTAAAGQGITQNWYQEIGNLEPWTPDDYTPLGYPNEFSCAIYSTFGHVTMPPGTWLVTYTANFDLDINVEGFPDDVATRMWVGVLLRRMDYSPRADPITGMLYPMNAVPVDLPGNWESTYWSWDGTQWVGESVDQWYHQRWEKGMIAEWRENLRPWVKDDGTLLYTSQQTVEGNTIMTFTEPTMVHMVGNHKGLAHYGFNDLDSVACELIWYGLNAVRIG